MICGAQYRCPSDFFIHSNDLVPKLIQDRLAIISDVRDTHWINLIKDTSVPFKISENVCWEILHTLALASEEIEFGQNFCSGELGFQDLAILYKILFDFNCHFEERRQDISVIFQENIKIVDSQLINLCHKNRLEARVSLKILIDFHDINFRDIVTRMKGTLVDRLPLERNKSQLICVSKIIESPLIELTAGFPNLDEILNVIFNKLKDEELAACDLVSRQWHNVCKPFLLAASTRKKIIHLPIVLNTRERGQGCQGPPKKIRRIG